MKQTNKGIDLAVSTLADTSAVKYDLAVLPWGATEPHNRHLPYLTDAILSHAVSTEAAAKAAPARCMVLPPVTFGAQNPGQREQPFCIHAGYRTQFSILEDIVASLYCQGLRRLVIVNGHGGNSFKNMIRDLAVSYPDFTVACCEWYAVVPRKGFFDAPGEHADELETSVMLHYHPELVDMNTAGEGISRPFAMQCLNEKTLWIPRNWSKVTVDTGIGDPRGATAEKGARFAGAVTDKLAEAFRQMAAEPLYLQD